MGYVLLLLLLTEALLRFGGGGPRAVLSLMNVVLAVVPLVSLVFGTMYLYGSRDFIELLLAQPVGRSALFVGPLRGTRRAARRRVPARRRAAVPLERHGRRLAGDGSARDAARRRHAADARLHRRRRCSSRCWSRTAPKGSALAILLWLAATALYDALLVLVATSFSDLPLEVPLIGLTLLNPVDLGRVLLLLHLDTAALMGYTGAVFERFFGSLLGTGIVALALVFWCVGPLLVAHRRFGRKDF